MHKYSSIVRWSDEDQCFIATSPEFIHVSAFGDTPEEALDELNVARQIVIDVMEEDQVRLPVPEKVEQYSGQFRVRIPKSLHRSLSESAQREGVSLNAYVMSLLAERNAERRVVRIGHLRRQPPPYIEESRGEETSMAGTYGEEDFSAQGFPTEFLDAKVYSKASKH